MDKGGDEDDCVSTSKTDELAESLSKKEVNNLPMPGQVDFISGGPPCQVHNSPPSLLPSGFIQFPRIFVTLAAAAAVLTGTEPRYLLEQSSV